MQLIDVNYVPLYKKLDLVFEYVEMDLKKFLKQSKGSFEPGQIKSFVSQILKGTLECHKKRVIHRDLKPQNILVDTKTNTLKLADFGLARAFTIPIKTLTHEIETLWYRAPEVLLGQKEYSLGVDTWAIGCIFAEFFEKKPIFIGDSEIDQIFKIFQLFGTPNESSWPGISELPDFKSSFPKFRPTDPKAYFPNIKDPYALDLILKLLSLDPSKRISTKEALEHPYFDN